MEGMHEETTNRFSAVAFAFGQMLSDSLQVPVGLILNAIGGSPAEAWIDRKTLEFEFPDILYDWKQNNFIQDWTRERAALNIRKSTNKQQRHPYEPCYLYESGTSRSKSSRYGVSSGIRENRTLTIWKHMRSCSIF